MVGVGLDDPHGVVGRSVVHDENVPSVAEDVREPVEEEVECLRESSLLVEGGNHDLDAQGRAARIALHGHPDHSLGRTRAPGVTDLFGPLPANIIAAMLEGAGESDKFPSADPEPAAAGATEATRPASWVVRHPLLVVAFGAGLVALGHAFWIWRYRRVGAFDPDEAGYIAGAMQLHRVLVEGRIIEFVRLVGSTGNGITVPLLSVPFLILGPLDPRTAMMAQLVFLVVGAVAVAGIARRIGGSWAAIVAGLVFTFAPTTMNASQSYWYGLAATAFAACAIWALLCSERCTNRNVWWFGVASGLMLLSRTMTLGFAPALFVAALVVAGRDRRSLTRACLGFGVGVLIAAPWYVYNASSIFGYLFMYGYGHRAARFGHGSVLDRAGFRFERVGSGISDVPVPFLLTMMFLLGAAVIVAAVRLGWRVRAHRTTLAAAWHRVLGDARTRSATAVLVAVLLGFAALVSTTNNGVWFELPVLGWMVALVIGLLGVAPWPAKAVASVLAVTSSVVVGAQLWWLVDYAPQQLTAHYEYGFEQYDTRFSPTSRSLHPVAARDWRRFNEKVLGILQRDRTPETDPIVTISGNMQLFNSNSLWLTGELARRPPIVDVPDTAWSKRRLLDNLTPTAEVNGERRDRVLVISLHHRILFTPDEGVERFLRLAISSGWRVTDTVDLPTGGEVQILRHA